MATIDRADWHYGGEFPSDLPREAGATHIGFFLAWALVRGHAGAAHDDVADAVADVVARRMTGRQFLLRCCDEKLWPSDLDDEAAAFAAAYYDASYIDDYVAVFSAEAATSVYAVADTWENFDRIAGVLDERFDVWRATGETS